MKACLTAVMLMLGFGSLLRAEPLDRRQLPADVKWMVHVDFDAVKSSKVAQKILDEWVTRESTKQSLRKVREAFGTDLTRDLHGVTFYSKRFAARDGVVIVQAKVDRQRLMAYVKKLPDHRITSHHGHELFAWTQSKGREHEHTVTGCFHRPTVMVFGRDAADVKAALDVLDGKSRSLAGSGSSLEADAPAGTVLQARAIDLAEAGLPFKSPIVRQTDLLAVAVGEHAREVFARARLVAKSTEVAGQVRTILEGFLAMAKLQYGNNENMMKVLRSIEVTTAEKTVTVQWRGQADDVLKLIEKAWKKQRKPKRKD